MPELIYSSDSENDATTPLSGRKRQLHAILGRGKVADVLLWKDVRISAALMIGMSVIWLLFEVAEYNFLTLFCHISITIMLIVFIWCIAADFFNWNPPQIPPSILHESTFRDVALIFHRRFNQALSYLLDIACGRDPALFMLVIVGLYILSVIGNYFTFLNFLYFGFLCLQTLPFLYQRYEAEVDHFANRLTEEAKRTYQRFDANVLNKIPRGPVKEKKVT